jgi:hypothetical protein
MVKPASLPTPWIGGRRHHQDIGLGDRGEIGIELVEKRHEIFAFAALAPILEDDIGDAGALQRRAIVER